MLSLLLMFLLQLPIGPKPPLQLCSVDGLHLSTKAMTQQDAFNLASGQYGPQNVLTWASASTVYIGIRTKTPFGTIEPDKQNCVSPNCFKNTNGSWRSAWNALLIDLCQRQQK